EHIHAHLDVFYDGQRVTVPAYVGIDLVAQAISPLHTHDTSGVVHIESPVVKDYRLGQFFIEWGVEIRAHPAVAYVNGLAVTTPPADLVLHAHDEIALLFGIAPPTIPSTYQFPPGY
ncbi:MAG: hypothetical protein ACYDD7_21800, partial [Acidimicrobiales bacterium]